MDDRTGSVDVPSQAPGADPNTDARTRELRAEIERTREDLTETVDAIQEKLRPGNLAAIATSSAVDKVKHVASTTTETVKDIASTTTERVKDMAQNVAGTTEEWWESNRSTGIVGRIRDNPLPALLAGAGLTWLALCDSEPRRRQASRGEPPTSVDWRSSPESAPRHSTESMGKGSAPRQLAADTRESLRAGRDRLETMVRDYPLAVGAAALIIGASLGMAVPESERENEWMGEARDSAVQRAQEAAEGAVDRVKDAAAEVVTRAAMGE